MKFRFREVYGVSEKSGKTKCELQMLDSWKAEAICESVRNILRESNPKYMSEPLPKVLYVPDSFTAYSQLAEGDTFDRSVGRRIAREKAYNKYAKWAKKFTKYVREVTAEISETINVNEERFED